MHVIRLYGPDTPSQLRARYDTFSQTCVPIGTFSHVPCSTAILVTDFSLVSLMLVGLLRLEESRHFGLVRYLYRQVR
jgi:hypothetical protein